MWAVLTRISIYFLDCVFKDHAVCHVSLDIDLHFSKKQLNMYLAAKCLIFIWKREIWELSKSKVFPDKKLNVAWMMKFASESIENIVRKEENAGYQHFLLFSKYFQTPTFLGLLNTGLFNPFTHSGECDTPPKDSFRKHHGKKKRRKRWWPAFSSFPTIFSNLYDRNFTDWALFNFLPHNPYF